MMTLSERVETLIKLGNKLADLTNDDIRSVVSNAYIANSWFTERNIDLALTAIRDQFLSEEVLRNFVFKYHLDDHIIPQKVGLILAGNIPLVGFHDLMCCYLSGHHCIVKLSDKDHILMQFVISELKSYNPKADRYITMVEKIKDYDAAIVTGSNNTAKHFEYYFKDVPHIIRKNRNSIAVLHGDENKETLQKLGEDIFSYFGLGCRNVSKIFVPKDYDITKLFEAFTPFKEVIHHNKYKNNYDYNVALNLLNKETFLQNELLILKEDTGIISRIGSIHYEYFDDIYQLCTWIQNHESEIQCVVSQKPLQDIQVVNIGETQCPSIDTYADGIDTMQFLLSL
jgi:hypothetical protein